jgi:hypothetical protein
MWRQREREFLFAPLPLTNTGLQAGGRPAKAIGNRLNGFVVNGLLSTALKSDVNDNEFCAFTRVGMLDDFSAHGLTRIETQIKRPEKFYL